MSRPYEAGPGSPPYERYGPNQEDLEMGYQSARDYPPGYPQGSQRGVSRNFSRNRQPSPSNGQMSRYSHQWNSWKSRRSSAQQPITINLSFGGGDGSSDPSAAISRRLTMNSSSSSSYPRRKSYLPWSNEMDRHRFQAPPPGQLPNGSNDLQVNLLRNIDPSAAYRKILDDEKAYYPTAPHGEDISYPLDTKIKLPTAPRTPPPIPPHEKEEIRYIIEPEEGGIRRMIQNFDFKWYGSTMGTGIVSALLFTFSETYPNSADLLFQLSVVFYIMNIALFSVIFLLTLTRYILYPGLFLMMISDPAQAMYLGTFPMGFATIITMTCNVTVPKFGSPWDTIVFIFWYVDVAVSLATCLGIPWLLQTRHHGITDLKPMTAGWLLPIVPPIVAAATGAAVSSVLDPDRALVVIITSYTILGTGLVTALVVLVIYFLRIATQKLPPVEHMVSTFLPLGALGQGGFAFQRLGIEAMRVFPQTGTFPDLAQRDRQLAGEIFHATGFMAAIILWGFGLVWLFLAVMSVTRQKVPFSLGWWAFTFPLGVFATSALAMGESLPSVTFQTLGTIFAVVVMGFWALVTGILISKLATDKWSIFKSPEVRGAHNQRKQ